jgi:8-oxo-dGTP diphosphatase
MPEVAIAILHQQRQHEQQFLMQLRDNIPTIVYPGHWAFFGGHLDPGESPDAAVRRELLEEIGYLPPGVRHFRSYPIDPHSQIIRHVYQAELTVGLADLELNEGWDMDFLTIADIQRGDRHSAQAGRVCPLGAPHQKILLDFLQEQSGNGF